MCGWSTTHSQTRSFHMENFDHKARGIILQDFLADEHMEIGLSIRFKRPTASESRFRLEISDSEITELLVQTARNRSHFFTLKG